MYLNVFEIFGTIAINNEQANKALADTGKQANGLSNKMEAAFSKMQSTARKIGTAVATAFAVDKIKDFGLSCAETFASVAAEEAAYEQIMGEYAERATEKIALVADQTGVVATRLTPYMTSMTAKFKGLGYDVEEATNLAAEGLIIASDASAFWDKSLDESMSHLNSFINGSYQGGEAIGLFANDTQMAAYAVEQGVVKETKAWSQLDEARKQSLRLQYAKEMMASSGATGQAALEAENYANVQANLTEHLRQFQSVIGEPIMNNIMLPAMRRLSQYMPNITEKTTAFIKTYSEGFRRLASHFSKIFTEEGIDLSALPGAFSSAIASIWPTIQEKCRIHLGIELPKWANIERNVTAWWAGTKRSIDNICTWALQLPSNPDGSMDQIALTVKGWWTSTALPAIKSVSGWTLSLFDHPIESKATIEQHVNEWWKVAGEAVAGACSWTLQLFGEPKESADEVGNLISTWWNKVYDSAQNACKALVGLELTNTDENGKRWSIVIADWFHARVGEVAEQLKITFDVITPDAEQTAKIQNTITTWLHGSDGKSGIVGLIANAIAFPFDLAFQECVNIWEEFQVWLDSISGNGKISTEVGQETEWAKGAKYDYRLWGYGQEELGLLQKWIDAVNEFKKLDMSATEEEVLSAEAAKIAARQAIQDALGAENAEQLISDYMSWLSGQVESETEDYYKDIPVSLVENAAADLQAELNGMNLKATVTMLPDYSGVDNVYGGRVAQPPMAASHAKGLDFVPRDGYLARLHYGEAVLNRTTADMLRSGSGMGDTSRLEAMFGQMMTIMQQVAANTSGGRQVVLDSGVLVGQLAPALDTQLGTISSRKGRRN